MNRRDKRAMERQQSMEPQGLSMVDTYEQIPMEIYSKPEGASYSNAVQIWGLQNTQNIMFQFVSSIPTGRFENHKTIIPQEVVKDLVDNICTMLNYTPKKKDFNIKDAAESRKRP